MSLFECLLSSFSVRVGRIFYSIRDISLNLFCGCWSCDMVFCSDLLVGVAFGCRSSVSLRHSPMGKHKSKVFAAETSQLLTVCVLRLLAGNKPAYFRLPG